MSVFMSYRKCIYNKILFALILKFALKKSCLFFCLPLLEVGKLRHSNQNLQPEVYYQDKKLYKKKFATSQQGINNFNYLNSLLCLKTSYTVKKN